MMKSEKGHLSESFVDSHLSRLEELVDVDHVIGAEKKQLDVFNFQPVKILPVLITMRDDVAHCSSGHGEWPSFTFDQMWNDYPAMLLNEMQPVYESVLLKDDKVFTVRPNLSQNFIPSMFGAKVSFDCVNEDSMPAVYERPSKEKLFEIIKNGIDYKAANSVDKYCRIIETWRKILAHYPKLEKLIHFSLPDLQGPFNLFFLLRGADAYIDFYEDPDFVHKIMGFITEILIETTNYLAEYIGQDKIGYYWNYAYPGRIRNVDDNSVLISKDQYLEFVHPYNRLLALKCGGGIHHYCGNGDQIIDVIMEMENIHGLNFGNPELQDWDMVYEKALKNRVVLLWDREIFADKLRKMNLGVITKIVVPTIEQAHEKIDEFRI